MRGVLVFDILSWWHAGTGRGDGPSADAVVARTAEGLPFLPGRTVKGLVRDAARLGMYAGIASKKEIEDWFGSELIDGNPENRERRLEETRFATRPGSLRFESATLGESWARWARAHPEERELLVSSFTSTSIDDDGVARDETLRVIEISVPLALRAEVTGLCERSAALLDEVVPLFLRGVGSHRNRGFGRVAARLELT